MKVNRPAVIINAAFLSIIMLIGLSSGFSGVLILAGLYLLVVFLIAWISGRGRWLGLQTRAASAAASAVALALVFAGGALAPSAESAPAASGAEPSPSSQATPAPYDLDDFEADLVDTADDITDFETAGPPVYSASGRSELTRTTAIALLSELEVSKDHDFQQYAREHFGSGWQDLDANGCNTRNEILDRDLDDPESSDSCIITSGILTDPFSGETVSFARGQESSSEVEIAHLVTPAQAWRSGAESLSDVDRTNLSNDPINLLAVSAASRAERASSSASAWLPPNKQFRCEYAARQISVKSSYGLSVTASEFEALASVLTTCEGQRGYLSELSPLDELEPEPTPSSEAPRTTPPPPPESTTEPEPAEPQAPAPTEDEEESAPSQRTGITPGAWCKRAEVGDIATGKNGKTYQCMEEGNKGRWKPI